MRNYRALQQPDLRRRIRWLVFGIVASLAPESVLYLGAAAYTLTGFGFRMDTLWFMRVEHLSTAFLGWSRRSPSHTACCNTGCSIFTSPSGGVFNTCSQNATCRRRFRFPYSFWPCGRFSIRNCQCEVSCLAAISTWRSPRSQPWAYSIAGRCSWPWTAASFGKSTTRSRFSPPRASRATSRRSPPVEQNVARMLTRRGFALGRIDTSY